MPKTITLRLKDEVYQKFLNAAIKALKTSLQRKMTTFSILINHYIYDHKGKL